jgi:sulfide dehydrogenase cytochrome subunit
MLRPILAGAMLVGLAASAPAAAADEAPLAALACGGCHGVGSTGQGPIPGIAGRPADQIIAAMNAFRSNERPGTIMGRIARGYSEAETAAIATWLAAQPREAATR